MLNYTDEQKAQAYDMVYQILQGEVKKTMALMELHPDDFDVAQYGVILVTALGLTLSNIEEVDPKSPWVN